MSSIRHMVTSLGRRGAVAALFVLGMACGGVDEVGPDTSLGQFVGDWDADRFVVRNKANPAQAPELIGTLGAQFSLNIQPSGAYTAILGYQGLSITEIGVLEVDGAEIIFHVSFPAPGSSRSRYALTGTRLTLDGDTEFDFNLDRVPDPAEAHIELRRR